MSIFFLFIVRGFAFAQSQGDTIAHFSLDEIVVFTEYHFRNDKERSEYIRLEHDLRKIYPLVKLVKTEYERVNAEMMLYDEKRRKAYLKWYENYARENYMPMLSGFSFAQGRLFLQMIDRELGQSPYNLIKMYRNGFRAVFGKAPAFMLRANLKADYKPEENPMVEHILRKIKTEEGITGLTGLNRFQTF